MCLLRKSRSSGQATLEYLFLIFFTVVLVSGFAYQFNGAVRAVFDSYFSPDGYLACLIEKGLLPGEVNDEGGCELAPFDMKNGKTREVAAVTFDGGKNSESKSSGGNGGGLGRTDATSASSTVPYGKGGPGSVTAKNNKPAPVVKKPGANTGSDEFSTVSNTGGINDFGKKKEASSSRLVPYGGDSSDTNAVQKKSGTVPATSRDMKTVREVAFEKASRKNRQKGVGATGFDLSFGNILKWIFIILLLFAIFFFIGSQIVAVSNGNRKRR